MKKLTGFILSLCLFSGIFCLNAGASGTGISVFIDQSRVEFDVQPQLIGGRTMVPLRAIFERLGATVQWDETTQTVTAFNEIKIVKATINSNEMLVNGEVKTMDVAPMILNDRTLVPARFVAEAFDCKVEWDADNMAVYITTAPIDYSKAEQGANSGADSSYYVSESGIKVPTYDNVTGAKYLGAYERIYRYECTTSDDSIYYIKYLMSEGWTVYNTKNDTANLSMTTYMVNGSDMIAVSIQFKYNEVWIII